MINVNEIKKDFPIFQSNEEKFVYLDSAATTQKPKIVLDTISEFYSIKNSSISRGLYKLSENATYEYEEVRKKVSKFINSDDENQIVFTKNTTEAINIVAFGYPIKKGDKIVTSIMEHHSNFVPWQQVAKIKKAKLEIVDIDEMGELDLADFEKKCKDAKIVAISAASNVLGTINEIKTITNIAREKGAIVSVDGAQSVPTMKTDIKKLDVDFLSFSGHKMLAPFGVGVLYGKSEILEKINPLIYGSQMIKNVDLKNSQFSDAPTKFESGTNDPSAVIGFGKAIEYLQKIGLEKIQKHEEKIINYGIKRLQEINGLKIYGPKKRVGLVSFTLEGIHPHDISAILDEEGIAIRSGHHCAMPLHNRLGIIGSSRASAYIYNDENDFDRLYDGLIKAKKIFGN